MQVVSRCFMYVQSLSFAFLKEEKNNKTSQSNKYPSWGKDQASDISSAVLCHEHNVFPCLDFVLKKERKQFEPIK